MPDLNVSWQKILHDAIRTPRTISEAYSRFHSYSVGNQLLALMQCNARGLHTVCVNNWFVLAQIEGAEYQPEPLPTWDESLALATLEIERVGFDDLDGNTQGYASGRRVTINPVAAMPHKTLFHELACSATIKTPG